MSLAQNGNNLVEAGGDGGGGELSLKHAGLRCQQPPLETQCDISHQNVGRKMRMESQVNLLPEANEKTVS